MVVTGNLLTTGRPGSGKTTLIHRPALRLIDCSPVGFYTIEVREEGVRVGFRSREPRRETAALRPHRVPGSLPCGRYGVDIEGFEDFLSSIPFFTPDTRLAFIDEIGKMECYSGVFRGIVREALDAFVPCVATIAQRGIPGLDRIGDRADVRVVEVTPSNRDGLLPGLKAEARRLVGDAGQGWK